MHKLYIALGLLLGSLCMSSCTAPKENTLRMMTYNIHNAIGMDDKVDIERVSEVILREAPDVVAVQEVDSVTERSGKIDLLKEIGEQTGMCTSFAPAIEYQGGKYGIGILSKTAPKSLKQIPLPGREEARTLLLAEFDAYYFACVHLSLTAEDRNASAALIRQVLPDTDKPVFLAGDWNMEATFPEFKEMERTFTILNDTKESTYPSPQPEECLDYVVVAKQAGQDTPVEILSREVVEETVASDHRPVVVAVKW